MVESDWHFFLNPNHNKQYVKTDKLSKAIPVNLKEQAMRGKRSKGYNFERGSLNVVSFIVLYPFSVRVCEGKEFFRNTDTTKLKARTTAARTR